MGRILGHRAGILLVVLAYVGAGALYGEAVPPWEAPDEPWHMAYVEALAAGRLPAAEETYEAHQPPLYYVWPALAVRALGISKIPRAPDNPTFPFATAAYLHPPGDPGEPLLRLVRTFAGMLGALAVVLTWASVRAAAPDDPPRAMLAALAIALLPQFLFISHSVSNDTLAAAVGAFLVYALVRWVSGSGFRGVSSVLVGVGLALGLLTKLNVLALMPAVMVGAIMVGRRQHLGRRRLTAVMLAAGGLPVLAGLAFWATLPDAAAALASDAAARALTVRSELAHPVPLAQQMLRLLLSLWARFGWLNVDLPWSVDLLAGGLAALGVVGLIVAWSGMGHGERRAIVVALVAFLSMLAATAKNLLAEPQPQGRFLFPALAAVCLLLATGWRAVTPPPRQRGALAALALFLVAVNLLTTGWWLPRAYARWRTVPPAVDARVVQVPWHEVARLDGPEGVVRQTFHVYRAGLHRVTVAVAQVQGEGLLDVRLLTADGRLLVSNQVRSVDAAPNSWLGLDVGPLADSAGQDYALELRLVGEGSFSFWGTSEDVYPEGGLWVNDRPATDLMLLTFLAAREP